MGTHLCPTCGAANAVGAEFCANTQCGAFLRWDPPAAPPAPPVQPAKREPGRPEPGAPSVRVEIENPTLAVQPGQSAATTVRIHNLGHQVEELAVTVVGPAASFSAVDPPTVKIYPKTATTCTVRFSPPRSPAVPAGAVGYGVQASSWLNNRVAASDSGTITIGAYTDLTAELTPEETRSRRRSVHYLTLVNNGNGPQRVHLAASDRENALRFALPPSAIELPPGRTPVPIEVHGRAAIFGAATRRPFDVAVSSADGATLTRTAGTRVTPPWIPQWLLAAAAVIALLGASMATLAKLAPTGGEQKPEAPASAAQQPPGASADTGGPGASEPPPPPPPSVPPNPQQTNGSQTAAAKPGQLEFEVQPVPPNVVLTGNLTAEGSQDWIQWGFKAADAQVAERFTGGAVAEECDQSKCANRKRRSTPLISNFESVGRAAPARLRDREGPKWNWTDGAPTGSASSAQGSVTVGGVSNGFALTVPADQTLRTLRLYVSVLQGRAQFTARLSDNSAAAVDDTSIEALQQRNVGKYATIEIRYKAGSAKQNLKIGFQLLADASGGSVALHAASLR